MSSIRVATNSHASFKVNNDRREITRFDNRRHLHSRIDAVVDYPTPYEVSH